MKYTVTASRSCSVNGQTYTRRTVAADNGKEYLNYFVVVPTPYGNKEIPIPTYHASRDCVIITMLIDNALME